MLVEQHFSDISRHPKAVSREWKAAVAEYLEEVGATDLDDPNAPKRKTPRTEAQLRDLDGFQRTKARNKAKLEHQEALARLENGTAVLRQKNERTKPAPKAKQVKVAKVAKKPAKAAKPIVKKTRKPYHHKPNRLLPSLQIQAQERRKIMLEKLQAGEFLPMQPKQAKKGDFCLYRQQHAALKKIKKESGVKIVRIRCIKDGQSFWAIDNFKRHQMDRAITGRLDDADRIPLITAITSSELVLASDIKNGTRIGVSSTAILARNHGMNIYTVFSGKYVLGWILMDDNAGKTAEVKRESEIDDLGDMLEALDYLKAKQQRNRNDLLPMCVPDVILDAAFREFKRVEKDGQ